jgi:uncharacterized membrane protein
MRLNPLRFLGVSSAVGLSICILLHALTLLSWRPPNSVYLYVVAPLFGWGIVAYLVARSMLPRDMKSSRRRRLHGFTELDMQFAYVTRDLPRRLYQVTNWVGAYFLLYFPALALLTVLRIYDVPDDARLNFLNVMSTVLVFFFAVPTFHGLYAPKEKRTRTRKPHGGMERQEFEEWLED